MNSFSSSPSSPTSSANCNTHSIKSSQGSPSMNSSPLSRPLWAWFSHVHLGDWSAFPRSQPVSLLGGVWGRHIRANMRLSKWLPTKPGPKYLCERNRLGSQASPQLCPNSRHRGLGSSPAHPCFLPDVCFVCLTGNLIMLEATQLRLAQILVLSRTKWK